MEPLSAVRLDVCSDPQALDLIELVTEHVSRSVGFEEDARYWIVAAVREAAMNAIDHGNRRDPTKHVLAEFATVPLDDASEPLELVIRIRDEGDGFDPGEVPDPTAAENLLKPSGRGLLLMRHGMDEVYLDHAEHGATEIRLVKRLDRGTFGARHSSSSFEHRLADLLPATGSVPGAAIQAEPL